MKSWLYISFFILFVSIIAGGVSLRFYQLRAAQKILLPNYFSGERALLDIEKQLAMGPRIPGTPGHDQIVDWLKSELEQYGWVVDIQETEYMGILVRNVVGKQVKEGASSPWIILGAHYDTRMFADEDPDPDLRDQPVPGANDGASGVAVLLELARVLPRDLPGEIWLVFFDAEDNGRIPGWEWIMGSRAFVEHLEDYPDAAVILDMIGDADLQIYYERSSDQELLHSIWRTAHRLGYSQFIPEPKYHMIDDHTPFLEAGIRAGVLIDFDYPYWHTTQDTLDKVSAESLEAVGRTMQEWLESEEWLKLLKVSPFFLKKR
jgi:glutaminyl-peptide cyclotransferase